jgi:hypothetical protein
LYMLAESHVSLPKVKFDSERLTATWVVVRSMAGLHRPIKTMHRLVPSDVVARRIRRIWWSESLTLDHVNYNS